MSPVIPLFLHPASDWHPDARVHVRVSWTTTENRSGLSIEFTATGDLQALRWPEPAQAQAADGLWQHTCFEAFLATNPDGSYEEYNFSPSSQWARYPFQSERQRSPTTADARAAPQSQSQCDGQHAQLHAWIPTAGSAHPPLRIGLTAVLEHQDGRLSYWALCHPKSRPDFHDAAGWIPFPAQSSIATPSD